MALLDEPVEKFARKTLFYVNATSTVSDAVREMKEHQTISVFIKKDNKIVGIITQKDIIFKVIAEGMNPAEVMVSAVMSSPVLSVKVDDPIRTALDLMSMHDVRRLLVIDKRGLPFGIIVEKHLEGDLIERSMKARECGIKRKSWLEQHVLEISEETLEREH